MPSNRKIQSLTFFQFAHSSQLLFFWLLLLLLLLLFVCLFVCLFFHTPEFCSGALSIDMATVCGSISCAPWERRNLLPNILRLLISSPSRREEVEQLYNQEHALDSRQKALEAERQIMGMKDLNFDLNFAFVRRVPNPRVFSNDQVMDVDALIRETRDNLDIRRQELDEQENELKIAQQYFEEHAGPRLEDCVVTEEKATSDPPGDLHTAVSNAIQNGDIVLKDDWQPRPAVLEVFKAFYDAQPCIRDRAQHFWKEVNTMTDLLRVQKDNKKKIRVQGKQVRLVKMLPTQ
jgi:hypothetical protein